MNQAIIYQCDDNGIGTIVFNRPKYLNALNQATAIGLNEAFTFMSKQSNLKAVLVYGNGKAFMAGGDLNAFAHDFDDAPNLLDEMLDKLEDVLHMMNDLPVPVITFIHGAAAGAGLSFAAASDVVIATRSCHFVLAYNSIGAVPDCGGSWSIPRAIGKKRYAAMMFLSETMSATEAQQAGLVSRIIEEADFDAEIERVKGLMAKSPCIAFAGAKQLLATCDTVSLQEQLNSERQIFKTCMATEDFKHGVECFLNKQKAIFKGK